MGDSHRERISHHRAIVCVNLVIEVALHPAVHCETTSKSVDNPRRCSVVMVACVLTQASGLEDCASGLHGRG